MNPLAPLAVVSSAIGGVLSLAAQSSSLPSFAAILKGNESSNDNPPVAAEAEVDLNGRLQNVADKLRQRLANSGIDLSQPISFSVSASGGIEVSSEHPQWREIEEILHGSPELAGELNELLSAATATSDDLVPEVQLVLQTSDAALLVEDKLVAAANNH